MACYYGDEESAKLLLDAEVDTEAPSAEAFDDLKRDYTPLMLGAREGYEEVGPHLQHFNRVPEQAHCIARAVTRLCIQLIMMGVAPAASTVDPAAVHLAESILTSHQLASAVMA